MTKKKKPPSGTTARVLDPADPPEMTVNEVAEAYPEQWVLMRVTGFNDYKDPWRGHILAVSPDEGQLTVALAREPKRVHLPGDTPQPLYYVFQAHRHVYTGAELEALRVKLCGRGGIDGQTAEG